MEKSWEEGWKGVREEGRKGRSAAGVVRRRGSGAGETEAPAVAHWCYGCWGRPDAASATDQRSGGAWCPVTLARPRRRTGPHLQHSRAPTRAALAA